mmetsp:Transcript_346/g.472  ORF Transcript_346/g.472 Transcript_346/m.472 type:complete len:287 (-) Transcript_346:104-964(-)
MAIAIGAPQTRDYDDVTMVSLMEEVLPFRANGYKEALIEKLLAEGIASPSDLLKASKDALEAKLQTHASFNFIEMADSLSLRSAMEPDKPKAFPRSQSPRRCNRRSRSPANRSHSGGRRANSRPHRNNGKGDHRGGARNRNHSQGSQGHQGNHRSKKPEAPELWRAIEKGDEALVRELLDQGKDPQEKFQGWTPFMKAAEEGQVEILRMLHEKNVDMEAVNRKGRTALSFAAAPSMKRPTATDALRLLLELGADTSKKCERGMTAKDYAKDEKREDALKIFEQFES